MPFLEGIGVEHPVVQAGMGGGIAGAELAGAVSAAGGLGTIGILPPEGFGHEIARAREIAGGAPVAANLLVPFTTTGHVEACARAGVPAVFLHAGFGRALIERLHSGGALVLATVGTPSEAREALADGADALVVQGSESGGHLVGVEPALDALERLRQSAGRVPLLLAGGIAGAGDVRQALDAGAAAVVAGTRFLLTEECAAHPAYKRRVLAAERTLDTRLFGVGWPMRHRVVPNAATERWCAKHASGPRAVRALQRLSAPLRRLPLSVSARALSLQRPSVPLLGPTAILEGMPERLLDASPLYAGETALHIDSLMPAGEAVALLAEGRRRGA